MIGYFIIGCEIAFWVFVFAGLSVRYLLGMKRIGIGLLMATPVIDLLLLVATVMDLQRGATASMIHGIVMGVYRSKHCLWSPDDRLGGSIFPILVQRWRKPS